jgi:hypothetical protein
MKKLTGVIAFVLILLIMLIYRQLTAGHAGSGKQKVSVPTMVEEHLLLGSLFIQ